METVKELSEGGETRLRGSRCHASPCMIHTCLLVTVTNLSQASLGRPSPRALKPRLRYKLKHGVVGGVSGCQSAPMQRCVCVICE